MDTLAGRRAVRRHPRRGAVRRTEPRASSKACSTCCRDAIRPTSSPSCARASRGTASTARVVARQGAKHVAIANAGTIPDRGLYGVFLLGAERDRARVGELDEEMVFEARAGETFLLGASTWRIEQITHDRVIVSPGAGPAGQDAVLEGRSRRAGRSSSASRSASWCASCAHAPADVALARLEREHGLDRAGRGQPPAVSRRSAARRRRRARRSHPPHRADARRARRLARAACCRRSAAACTRRGRWP